MRPGLAVDGYLWFADVHRDWPRDCEEQSTDLRAALLRDLTLPEDAGHRYLSAQPDQAGPLPVRSGCWVGPHAVQRLLDGRPGVPPQRLLSWDCETAIQQLAHAMTRTGT